MTEGEVTYREASVIMYGSTQRGREERMTREREEKRIWKNFREYIVVYFADGESKYFPINEMGEFTTPDSIDEFSRISARIVKVAVSSGVKQLNTFQFAKCKALTEAILPDTLEKFSAGLFGECHSLEFVGSSSRELMDTFRQRFPDLMMDFTKELKVIEQFAMAKCNKLIHLKFPKKLKTIGMAAFTGCEGLETVSFNSNLDNIEKYAFIGCENLESVVFNGAVGTIQHGAFKECPKLRRVTVPARTTIEDGAFDDSVEIVRRSIREVDEDAGEPQSKRIAVGSLINWTKPDSMM